jgi:hypothetical protein
VRTDSVHGFVELKKFLAGTIQRAQTCAAGIDEGLVDVE